MIFGDLHWIDLPERGGHAQTGRRPAVIMQGAKGTVLSTMLVVPLTTQQDALRFPGTTAITPDATNGLKRLSVALAFQMTAVDRRYVRDKIGSLALEDMNRIKSALDELMDGSLES